MPQSAVTEPAQRIVSIDALRGLVMLLMIFVNDIASFKSAPWWLKHYPPDENGMTFVDLVFPAFLFIVGMSIPAAVRSRRGRGQGWIGVWLHIALRTLSLLVLGILMVNMPADARVMNWRPGLWEVSVFAAAIVAYMDERHDATRPVRAATIALRIVGFVALAVLATMYRGHEGRWLQTSWWGILGLIGWAYLITCLIYIPLRRMPWALFVGVAGLLALYFVNRRGAFDGLWLRGHIDFGSHLGSHASITLCGAILGAAVLPGSALRSHSTRIAFSVGLGVACAIAAILLYPSFGINKNAATPSWCMWASAITAWAFAAMYLLVDGFGVRRAVGLLVLAGVNALLIYLLQPLWYYLLTLLDVRWYGDLASGSVWVGIARAAGLAVVLALLAGLLNRIGVRLRI